jgi:hypothetical protein
MTAPCSMCRWALHAPAICPGDALAGVPRAVACGRHMTRVRPRCLPAAARSDAGRCEVAWIALAASRRHLARAHPSVVAPAPPAPRAAAGTAQHAPRRGAPARRRLPPLLRRQRRRQQRRRQHQQMTRLTAVTSPSQMRDKGQLQQHNSHPLARRPATKRGRSQQLSQHLGRHRSQRSSLHLCRLVASPSSRSCQVRLRQPRQLRRQQQPHQMWPPQPQQQAQPQLRQRPAPRLGGHPRQAQLKTPAASAWSSRLAA